MTSLVDIMFPEKSGLKDAWLSAEHISKSFPPGTDGLHKAMAVAIVLCHATEGAPGGQDKAIETLIGLAKDLIADQKKRLAQREEDVLSGRVATRSLDDIVAGYRPQR